MEICSLESREGYNTYNNSPRHTQKKNVIKNIRWIASLFKWIGNLPGIFIRKACYYVQIPLEIIILGLDWVNKRATYFYRVFCGLDHLQDTDWSLFPNQKFYNWYNSCWWMIFYPCKPKNLKTLWETSSDLQKIPISDLFWWFEFSHQVVCYKFVRSCIVCKPWQ